MFEAVEISREITGSGQNLLLCGDAYQQQPALSALAGQVQAVYIDPPFMTGETFTRRRRFGTSGWKTGRPMPEYPAYIDRFADTKEYLELLRSLIACAKALLNRRACCICIWTGGRARMPACCATRSSGRICS